MSRLLLLCLLLTALPPSAQGQVYRWVDDKGEIHYSTSPSRRGAEPAQLPEIKRESAEQRIETIREATPDNCQSHGEVDCTKGPDVDGSVVCLDGHRDAVGQFHTYCSTAKLQFERVEILDRSGSLLRNGTVNEMRRAAFVEITIRNVADVPAQGVKAEISLPRAPYPAVASGPAEVERFGLGEYRIDLGPLQQYLGERLERDFKKLRITLDCKNCNAETRPMY